MPPAADLIRPRDTPSRSWVWEHFCHTAAEPEDVWCMVDGCRPTVRCVKRKGSSTTNMARHIKDHHRSLHPSTGAGSRPVLSIRDQLERKQKDASITPCTPAQRVQFDKAVISLIVGNCMSFNVVDSEEFVLALHTVSGGRYLPLSRTLLTQEIDVMYRHMNTTLLADICDNSVSITTDGATLNNRSSYIAVTAHYITSSFSMREVTLMVARMTESHTGEYVSELLDTVIERFSLDNRVFAAVTDNGSNFTKAVRINSQVAEGLRCAIHTLQLSLGDAAEQFVDFRNLCRDVQALVCRIRNSHLLSAELLDIQVEKAATTINTLAAADADAAVATSPSTSASARRPLVLRHHVDTRFNSFCTVFLRLIAVRSAVVELCTNHAEELSRLALTDDQWELITEVVQVLEPVKGVCEILEASASPTLSLLIPLLVQLLIQLQTVASKHPAGSLAATIAGYVRNDIYDRVKEALESPTSQVSMMLDPRVRTKQLPNYNKAVAVDALRSAYLRFSDALKDLRGGDHDLPRPALASAAAASDSTVPPPAKRMKSLFDLTEENDIASPTTELDMYLREPGIALQQCPLQWWTEKASLYPTLAQMARVYLAIPASSAAAERVFSVGKLTLDPKRRSLEPDRVARLVFMKKNTRLYRSLC